MLIFFLFFCFFVLSIMFIFCKTINLTTNFRKRPHIVWKLPAKFLSHIFRSVCPSITFSVSALPPLPIPRDYRAMYPALFCDQFRSAHYWIEDFRFCHPYFLQWRKLYRPLTCLGLSKQSYSSFPSIVVGIFQMFDFSMALQRGNTALLIEHDVEMPDAGV